jgi:hypothetical protein
MITVNDIVEFGSQIVNDPALSDKTNPTGLSGSCRYYDEYNHSFCLVGYWLHNKLGVDHELMDVIEDTGADQAIAILQENNLIVEPIEDDAVKLLVALQSEADTISSCDHGEDDYYKWGPVISRIFTNEKLV